VSAMRWHRHMRNVTAWTTTAMARWMTWIAAMMTIVRRILVTPSRGASIRHLPAQNAWTVTFAPSPITVKRGFVSGPSLTVTTTTPAPTISVIPPEAVTTSSSRPLVMTATPAQPATFAPRARARELSSLVSARVTRIALLSRMATSVTVPSFAIRRSCHSPAISS